MRDQEKDIYVQFLGGASEVGATSIYIYWKGIKILVDSGKRNSSFTPYPVFYKVEKDIDILIITHLHQDHIGSLIECINYFNIKKIYTSRQNKAMMYPVLKDAQKFVLEENELLKKQYSDKKIEELIDRITVIDYRKAISIKGNLNIYFYETSHLLGSMGMLFSSVDYSLLLTSDFTESKKFFHPKTTFIEYLKNKDIDTLITETTYGKNEDGDEVLKENCLEDLAYAINTIFSENGNVLIPCFAIGRMQELILAIVKLIVTGKINENTQIYLKNSTRFKSLGMQITQKYFTENFKEFKEELPEKVSKYLKEFEEIENQEEILDKLLSTKFLNIYNTGILRNDFKTKSNAIFIVQPGMLGNKNEQNEYFQEKGKLALEIASGEQHGIIFVGYQAPETLGGVIKNSRIDEEMIAYNISYIRKNKNVYNVTFPGHVSIKGVENLIKQLNPENIMLVHGDILASKNVAHAIKNKNILIPEIDEKIYLLDNSKKIFFSMQHKFSKLIIDLKNEYEFKKDISLLRSGEHDENIMIKLLREKQSEYIIPKLLHFDFVVSDKNIAFYQKLQEELKDLNITSNTIIMNKNKDLQEVVADIISDTNEKAKIYLLSYSLEDLSSVSTLSQISGIDTYYYFHNRIEKILNLPFDVNDNEKIFVNKEKTIEDIKQSSEFKDLLNKLRYYRGRNLEERKDEKYRLRPRYNIQNKIYTKNIYNLKDNSLWGDIENNFGIKNKGVVEDLERIYSILEEKIVSIQMTNYIYTYNQNKEYREILGVDKNYIYGKYSVENGIQYFTIELREHLNAKDEVNKLDLQYEF